MNPSSRLNHFIIVSLMVIFSWTLMTVTQLHAGQPAQTKYNPKSTGDFDYIIGLGDVLHIQVWKEPELSRSPAPVRIDGRISLPLLGDVVAAGKSIKELTQYLETKYKDVVTEPAVSVMLIQSKSWRYYVVGEIAHPGEFTLDYPLTILQAIARSGGFSQWAKKSDITIIRDEDGQEKVLSFDYDALTKDQDLSQNIHIAPGDTIVIP